MHIGFVITSLVGGGAEKVVLNLAQKMVGQGHYVDLYVLTSRVNYDVPPNVNTSFISLVKKVPSIFDKKFYQTAADSFMRMIQENERKFGKHDLVIFNLPEDYVLGDIVALDNAWYCLHTSVQKALDDQLKRSKSRFKRLKRRFSSLNNKNVITVSNGVGRELEELEWLHPACIRTIYNPFDIEAIREKSAQAIDSEINYRYILHIGRAARVKRHDLLFEALLKIPSEYRLVLLSKDAEKLHKLAKRHNVLDRVVFPGFQDNPYKWIKHAELLVLCSDYEGLGNVLIESLICGTPVISTDCPYGPAEILTDELSEWLVPVNDSDALAEKINQALNANIVIGNPSILSKVEIDKVVSRYLSLVSNN